MPNRCAVCDHLITYPSRDCKMRILGNKTYVDNGKCALFAKRFEVSDDYYEKKDKKKR